MVKCKKCNHIFDVSNNQFGYKINCPKCNFEFVLDIDDLVKYSIPDVIFIFNKTLSEKKYVVFLQYEFRMPLILPPKDPLTIEKGFIGDAINDLVLYDCHFHGDISLRRFIEIKVLIHQVSQLLLQMTL